MNENKFSKRREPFAFMLYLAMFGSSILFLAVFLVFLKKEFVNQNIPLIIPKTLWVSSLVIVLSSMTIYLAKKQLSSQKFIYYKSYLGITYLLGLLFLVLQLVDGWN